MDSTVYYIKVRQNSSAQAIAKTLSLLIDRSRILEVVKRDDFTGVKLHFGEAGNMGHIKPSWIAVIVKHLKRRTRNIFLTDSNVLYKRSSRTNSLDHLKIAHEHGFGMDDVGVPILIADGIFGRNFVEVEINKKHLSKVKIASDIASCDSLIVASHLTGHMQTGLAGALKNLGMGCASRQGKFEQHSLAHPTLNPEFCTGCGLCVPSCPQGAIVMSSGKASILEDSCIGCGECVVVCRTKAIDTIWNEKLENLHEKMVEYAYGAVTAVKKNVAYINFLIHVTKDCDCLAKDEPRIAHNVGILASMDPVSIDKASADLINEAEARDIFREKYPDIDWTFQLNYASSIGLGSLDYKLKRL